MRAKKTRRQVAKELMAQFARRGRKQNFEGVRVEQVIGLQEHNQSIHFHISSASGGVTLVLNGLGWWSKKRG